MPITDQLEQLQALRTQGALTEEEFASAKARLLAPPPTTGLPPKSRGLVVAIGATLGVLVLLGLFFAIVSVLGILAAIAIPNFVAMQYRAKRAEALGYVDSIRTAELAYDAAFDSFIEVPQPVPRGIEELDAQQVPWAQGSAFETLGWGPDGVVRGTYWVEVQADGQDFVVHGMIDADGDGEPAHYTATASSLVSAETPSDVF